MTTNQYDGREFQRFEIPGHNFSIRELSIYDAEELFQLIDINRDHLKPFLPTAADKYQSLDDLILDIQLRENPDRRKFTIISDTGEIIGLIDCHPRDENCIEIRTWIGKNSSGKGYATNAVNLIVDYSINGLGYDSVIAFIDKDNLASRAVAEKCGFVLTSSNQSERIELTYIYKK